MTLHGASTAAVSGLVDWEHLTGQSKFVVDMVSIPLFSALAGVITNWTGVIMLFSPVYFHGFHCPGLKTIFPFLPRKLQILPTFAPGGILGFQGFIPARAEKPLSAQMLAIFSATSATSTNNSTRTASPITSPS